MMSDAAIPEYLENSMNWPLFSAAFHGNKTTAKQQVSFY
jgi:hypothetical protein